MANGKISSPAVSLSPVVDGSSPPAILTPSRRVKAILAQFDSSDSENEAIYSPKIRPKEHLSAVPPTDGLLASVRSGSERRSRDEDDEEDILPNAARGRLAARLQARNMEDGDSDLGAGGGESAYDRIKNQMQSLEAKTRDTSEVASAPEQLSSDGELTGFFARRRLLKRKSRPAADGLQRVTPSRSPSPLFFPSPPAAKKYEDASPSASHSDTDDFTAHPPTTNKSRFLELVEKHRKQRLAQEAADIAKRAARVEQLKSATENSRRQRGSSPADDSDEDSDLSNHGTSRKLSKTSRPTRKASKKAIEEMNRETQRMSRNMQLAHQAKIKKKITKESLLARFNFPLSSGSMTVADEDPTNSGTASSAPTSDAEGAKKQGTPPTSPLLPESDNKDTTFANLPPAEIFDSTALLHQDAEELSTMKDDLIQAAHSMDKGKGRAVEGQPEEASGPISIHKARNKPRPIRIKWSKEDAVVARAADSDSDLEIVTSQSKSRKLAVFERLPSRKARETPSHLALRSLAHITGITDKQYSSINAAQMEAGLRKAARMQARKERQEKIEELKAKGVIIQTAEEREKDQQEVEDLVERARQEAAEIQKKEKAIAKKDGTFVNDGLDDDDSDDEEDGDFRDEDDAQIETADEEEEDDDDEEEEEEEENEEEEEDGNEGGKGERKEGSIAVDDDAKGLIDDEADEQHSDEESAEDANDLETFIDDPAGEFFNVDDRQRRLRNTRILSDDEDEEPTNKRDGEPSLPADAKTPQSVPRSARKVIPGLQMSDDLPMGLTQAFAATLADSQSQDTPSWPHEQQSLAGTRQLPSASSPAVPNLRRLESLDVVTDSQPASQTQPLDVDLSFLQSQQVPQSLVGVTSTQFSQMPFEPTQDVGFVLSPFTENRFDTPIRNNAPHSTIETVIVAQENEQSPVLQRKGRLRRGRAATVSSDDEAREVGKDISAFNVMRRAAAGKEAAPVFDKAKSHAKDIVDEVAEESEDEYAGLGGASDDEVGEEDEDDRKMIDHDEKVGQGDEAKLAGLFADKERKQDEAAVSKLLKDITTGALRRKRGVGDELDLSDEEDEAARRREAKRREFARMRRELLKDEAVGKIAEDKKKEAFLKSIEDREAADDEDDLNLDSIETSEGDSQSQQAAQDNDPRELSANSNKRKRPLEPSAADALNRLPPALRYTTTKAVPVSRKPSTIAEIRESVSFLIEEPDSQCATPQYGSSDDEEGDPEVYVNLDRHLQAVDGNEEDDEDLDDFIVDDSQDSDVFKKPRLPPPRAPFAERRTKANVVDRRSLLRQASSSSSSSSSATSKMAFFTSKASSSDSLVFKVPSLLRRATTNSSISSVNSADVSATGVSVMTERGAPGQEKETIRKGAGGRRNAVNFRVKPKEEQMKSRITAKKGKATKAGRSGGFLGGLFGGNSWD